MKVLLSIFLLLFLLNFGAAKISGGSSAASKKTKAQVTSIAQPSSQNQVVTTSPPSSQEQAVATAQPSSQEQGFQGVRWGAGEAEIKSKLGSQIEKLPNREAFGNDTYAELSIPNYSVGGSTFTVFFQMNRNTDGLKQVLIQKYSSNSVSRSFAAEFEILSKLLTEKYGVATKTGEFVKRWTAGDTVIELDDNHTAMINTENLTIRYFPSGGSGKL